MSEKTLLKEVLLEKQTETSIEEEKQTPQIKSEEKQETKKKIYSPESIPSIKLARLREKYAELEEEKEINKIESKVSSVIEKPNYDTMETLTEVERKKIFVVKKGSEAKKSSPNRFKIFIFSLLFAFFSIWGIINMANISNISNQIGELSTQYELNLANYLKNLYMLDATNSENMENLFETIPDESKSPSQIEEQSNWFDRFCNFLGGLFGG